MANKKCPVAKKCSGCQLSNMTYEQQLEWKQKDTEKLLGGFGKVSKIIGADDPYNYRNKVQAVFRSDRNGRIISGVYQSSRNGIVGIDSCMLDDKRVSAPASKNRASSSGSTGQICGGSHRACPSEAPCPPHRRRKAARRE